MFYYISWWMSRGRPWSLLKQDLLSAKASLYPKVYGMMTEMSVAAIFHGYFTSFMVVGIFFARGELFARLQNSCWHHGGRPHSGASVAWIYWCLCNHQLSQITISDLTCQSWNWKHYGKDHSNSGTWLSNMSMMSHVYLSKCSMHVLHKNDHPPHPLVLVNRSSRRINGSGSESS